jgi:hypothetical protein
MGKQKTAFGKIMAFAAQRIRSPNCGRQFPVHVSQKAIDCPWEAKGGVMITLIEE